jgi:hypothetical protein
MSLGFMRALARVIIDFKASDVQAKHIELLKYEAELLVKSNLDLEKENRQLRRQVREFEEKAAGDLLADELVKHRGAAFKPKAGGGYDPDVYCPDCRVVAASPGGILNYQCPRCPWISPFMPHELKEIMKGLPGQSG